MNERLDDMLVVLLEQKLAVGVGGGGNMEQKLQQFLLVLVQELQ